MNKKSRLKRFYFFKQLNDDYNIIYQVVGFLTKLVSQMTAMAPAIDNSQLFQSPPVEPAVAVAPSKLPNKPPVFPPTTPAMTLPIVHN